VLDFIIIFKAIFLGVVEGLTEFLPVSSTAHLLLSSYLIDFRSLEDGLFEVVIQSGAILAICVLYHKKLLSVALNLHQKSQQLFVANLLLAFLPAAILGFLLYPFIKEYLFSNLVIAVALIVGGVLMILIDRRKEDAGKITEVDNLTPLKSLQIGFYQCLAMVPGVSRSGATIIGGLLCGLNRKTAAEFSFFLAIPTILSASVYDLFKNGAQLDGNGILLILIGFLASFFSAILVIKWFINFVSHHNFFPFAIYRILLGIMILLFAI
jgi:undecaprenyl-diphosphatase